MRTEDIEQFDEELWNIVKAEINGDFDLICVPGIKMLDRSRDL